MRARDESPTMGFPLGAHLADTGAQQPQCTPCRVLVVDDVEDTARTFAYVLETLGHQARAVTSPHDVFAAIASFRPNVVFLDIGMPDIDGWTLARQLREKYSRDALHLVALTAYGERQDYVKSREAGFDAHVVKPASPNTIDAILRTLFPESPPPRL